MTSTLAMAQLTVRSSLWAAGVFSVVLLLIYRETAMSMVSIWSRSETFAHGFLIVPISLWLIWTRRDLLKTARPEPALWVALLLIPLSLAWLLAWLVDVAVIQQLVLVAMLIGGAWAILGHQLSGILVFPLFFLFLAVPMGEELISPMMEFTARSTVWMVEMTGIPVYREGLNFTLPSGRWSVVEACSGVRYIIASITVGALYAYLTYRSWTRRVLFLIVSAIVPVFANSVRAYMIVMLGHLSGMTLATGADHLVYGWVFFGLVIFLLFWLGSFFREDYHVKASNQSGAIVRPDYSSASNWTLLVTLFSTLLLVSLAPLLAYKTLDNAAFGARLAPAFPPANGSWLNSANTGWRWTPPSRVFGQQSAYFERDLHSLGLYLQYADGAVDGADVIGSSSFFTREKDGWHVVMQDKARVQGPDGEIFVDEAQVRGAHVELLVWSWYCMSDTSTSNDYQAKVHQTLARLKSRDFGVYRIVIATPVQASVASTRAQLQGFLADYAPVLYQELRHTKALPR
ncbi:MAG TPA: exosortase A [Halioglobus sp.]